MIFLYKEENTLTDSGRNFIKQLVKGRVAETLIEELFLNAGYGVFRFGMENTVPGVVKYLRYDKSDTATNIRRMPDFVIQRKNQRPYFIEVKFRANEYFSIDDLKERDYPYKECLFIIISMKHIKCISYQELEAGDRISPEPENRKFYLGNRSEFQLDKNIIIQFLDLVDNFFNKK